MSWQLVPLKPHSATTNSLCLSPFPFCLSVFVSVFPLCLSFCLAFFCLSLPSLSFFICHSVSPPFSLSVFLSTSFFSLLTSYALLLTCYSVFFGFSSASVKSELFVIISDFDSKEWESPYCTHPKKKTHQFGKSSHTSSSHPTEQNNVPLLPEIPYTIHNSGPPTASRFESSIWSPTKSLEMALANSTAARLSKPWFDSCEVVWRSKTDSCSNFGDSKFGFNCWCYNWFFSYILTASKLFFEPSFEKDIKMIKMKQAELSAGSLEVSNVQLLIITNALVFLQSQHSFIRPVDKHLLGSISMQKTDMTYSEHDAKTTFTSPLSR